MVKVLQSGRLNRLLGRREAHGQDHNPFEEAEDEVNFIDGWLESLGRYIKFNQSVVLFEYYRKSKRALDLRDTEVWEDYDKGIVNPKIFDDDNLGSSRHTLTGWHNRFMDYWKNTESPRGAFARYPSLQRLRDVVFVKQIMQRLEGIPEKSWREISRIIMDQSGIR